MLHLGCVCIIYDIRNQERRLKIRSLGTTNIVTGILRHIVRPEHICRLHEPAVKSDSILCRECKRQIQTDVETEKETEGERKDLENRRTKGVPNLMYRLTDAAFSTDKRWMIGTFCESESSAVKKITTKIALATFHKRRSVNIMHVSITV